MTNLGDCGPSLDLSVEDSLAVSLHAWVGVLTHVHSLCHMAIVQYIQSVGMDLSNV